MLHRPGVSAGATASRSGRDRVFVPDGIARKLTCVRSMMSLNPLFAQGAGSEVWEHRHGRGDFEGGRVTWVNLWKRERCV